MEGFLGTLFNNERSSVVSSFGVVLDVRSVAKRKLFALPTTTKNTLISHIFNIDGIHNFSALHLDGIIASWWFETRNLFQFILKNRSNSRCFSKPLKRQVGETSHRNSERQKSCPAPDSERKPAEKCVWNG